MIAPRASSSLGSVSVTMRAGTPTFDPSHTGGSSHSSDDTTAIRSMAPAIKNDAVDIAARLRDLGFQVIEGNDLGKRALERKIGEFSDALDGAGVGLFYYAGHGLQVDGRNFIVPVDARLDVPAKLRLETVQIDDVLDIMEQQTKTSLVFLDACRNNPFARSLSRTATNRSAVALAGLAQFELHARLLHRVLDGTGFRRDGWGRAQLAFASALLRHIGEPGQSINDLMIAVRRDVVSETHDTQRPWEQGSLLERFEFVPRGQPAMRIDADGQRPNRRADAGRRPRTLCRRQQVGREFPRRRISCARRGCNPRSRQAGLRPVRQDLRLGTGQRRHRQAEDRLVRAIYSPGRCSSSPAVSRSRRAGRTVPTPSLR